MKIGGFTSAILGLVVLFGGGSPSQAVVTSWNAYDDFYLSPTATGWTGAISPSASGSAWGYYMGNVNANGFPSSVGTYLTSSQIYRFTNHDPLGAGGLVYGVPTWYDTGGAGFPVYNEAVAWGSGSGNLHSSLGRYDTPWFSGAPGRSQDLTNLIWMQAVYLGVTGAEGIASMLTWTAPAAGTYTFSGLFVPGYQSANGASAAIVDSLAQTHLGRAVLGSDDLNATPLSFEFTKTYSLGDVVQFQVGTDFKTGNAVGLQVNVIPEPSSSALLMAGLAALTLAKSKRRKGTE